MGCNINRQNCSPDNIFAGNINTGCGGLIDPSVLEGEQLVYDNAYKDLINNYGVDVDYWVNTFDVLSADLIYGEHPTKTFQGPIRIKMYIELDQSNLTLSRFGFDPGDEFTGYIHIRTFTSTFSSAVTYSDFRQDIEPKSGDIIQLIALGCDRPNGRGANFYEITERRDEDISQINPLLGHYVWRIRGKRYDYSFEPGLSGGEAENEQIYENSFSGKLSSSITGALTSDTKSYPLSTDPYDIDDISSTRVLNQTINDTDIYGNYGY